MIYRSISFWQGGRATRTLR